MAKVQTPIVNAGLLYVNGLDVNYNTINTFAVQPGSCRDSTNTIDIVVSSPLVLSLGVVGALGIDSSLANIAPDVLYAVFVIADSSKYEQPSALFSKNGLQPVLPDGYDSYRRVGWVRTDPTAGPGFQLAKWYVNGTGQSRNYWYEIPIPVYSGATLAVFTEVPLRSISGSAPSNSVVPSMVSQVIFDVSATVAAPSDVVELLPFGSLAAVGMVRYQPGLPAAGIGITQLIVPFDTNPVTNQATVLAKFLGTTLTLDVSGYVDQLD